MLNIQGFKFVCLNMHQKQSSNLEQLFIFPDNLPTA